MPSPNLFPISSDTKKDGEKQGLRLLFLHGPFYPVCVFLSVFYPTCLYLSVMHFPSALFITASIKRMHFSSRYSDYALQNIFGNIL